MRASIFLTLCYTRMLPPMLKRLSFVYVRICERERREIAEDDEGQREREREEACVCTMCACMF